MELTVTSFKREKGRDVSGSIYDNITCQVLINDGQIEGQLTFEFEEFDKWIAHCELHNDILSEYQIEYVVSHDPYRAEVCIEDEDGFLMECFVEGAFTDFLTQ